MLCYVMLCYAMLLCCYVMLCYVVLCYVENRKGKHEGSGGIERTTIIGSEN